MAKNKKVRRFSPAMLLFIFYVFDAVVIYSAGIIASLICQAQNIPFAAQFAVTISLLTATFYLTLTISTRRSLSELPPHIYDYVKSGVERAVISAGTIGIISMALQIKMANSHTWIMLWAGIGVVAIIAMRVIGYKLLSRIIHNHTALTRVVIVGAGDQGQRMEQFIINNPKIGKRVIGFVDDRVTSDRIQHGLTILGPTRKIFELVRSNEIDEVIVALPWSAEARVKQVISLVSQAPIKLRLAPDLINFSYLNRSMTPMGDLFVLDLFERPISGASYVVKWLEDRILGLLMLIAAAPVMVAIAIAIKLDSPGPVFFRQNREGFSGETIRIFKFRSMYADKCQNDAIRQAAKNDSRITRVGAFLRKTSLDEVPQLLNVITGEMSLVGPRPHAPSTLAAGRKFEEIMDNYVSRHRVKPGITGWAQVNGWRGETETEDKLIHRVNHDIYYIENWSFWFDISIIFRTLFTVIDGENAY